MKILIVDDMVENLYMLESLLKGSGYEVVSAENGVEALESLSGDSIDMIISDILMPKMDGFQLCRECKKDDTLKKIPFIFYTATYTDYKDEKFALSLGAEKFIIKAIDPELFLEIMKDVLDKYGRGLLTSPDKPAKKEEPVFLKEYNERLVNKLEDKVVQLESSNNTLRESEKELRESEIKYRRIFENMQDVYYEASFDGTILEISPSIENVSQYKRKELIGRSLYDIYTNPEERDEFVKLILDKGKVNDFEISLTDKDGSQHPCSITTLLVKDEQGNPIKLIGSMHDISERKLVEEEKKKLETQLRQAQNIEAIGTLAGGIAHDFNNILSVVLGYTELALEVSGEGSLLTSNLQEIYSAGKRARDLIQHILTFSRQTDHEPSPVQVKLIVNEALKLLRASLPSTVEIRQDMESDSTIMADPTEIHRVLMNLCTNAGHAMQKDGGILEVSLVNVDVDADFAARHLDMSPGPHLRLTVSDTGYGIEPAIMKRIFDLYFTTKEKGEGTGMGLSVVSGIVKSHGGAITVYSEPGKGSTFNVFLPVIEDMVEAKREDEEPLPEGNERILFVDDEPSLVDVGRQKLESLGYEVVGTISSLEALELFKSQPQGFDLVITDMAMPHMTGDILAKEIMKIRPDIPIILCTGYSELISKERAEELGISAFAMKPLLMRELATAVRGVLDRGTDDC